ncbi:MAG TPA: hypothetical protein VN883_15845 [Myxococcales bacterium]|nr:hypothetical protein [Myxococcales bacterium]
MTREPMRDRDQRLALALLGGTALLLCELRFEHREALGETWRSWIPLAYAAVTLLAGLVALLRWEAGGRRVLAFLFGAGIAVGLLGFWFHTGGHLLTGLRDVLAAWRIPLGQDGGIKMGSRPPALAPLAFCGLGTLGLLVCRGPALRTRRGAGDPPPLPTRP